MGNILQYNPTGVARPEFGIDSNTIRTLTISLGTALDKKEYPIGGTCLWAYKSSSLNANCDVIINNLTNDSITYKRGMFIRGIPFSRIFISCTAQTDDSGNALTISFIYAREEPGGLQIENPSVDYIKNVYIAKSENTGTLVDLTLAAAFPTTYEAFPVDSTRRVAIMKSLISNTDVIRVGDSNIATNRGYPLEPGESASFETSAILYVGTDTAGQIISRNSIED